MIRRLLLCILLTLLCGCAAEMAHRQGEALIARGQVEEGIAKLHYAAQKDPDDAEFKRAYLVAREHAVNAWLEAAWQAERKEDEAMMEENLRHVLNVDPGNTRAREVRNALQRTHREQKILSQAARAKDQGDILAARAALRDILAENPDNATAQALFTKLQDIPRAQDPEKIATGLNKTLTLAFAETPLKQVFDVFSHTSGLNFVFDKDVNPDQKTTVYLKNTTVGDAINLILLTNQLERRVLNSSSILIYPALPAKIRDYQPLQVKTFFLNNAEAKNVAETLKTILKTKDLVVDDAQNMIIMRDSPDAIRIAEKLVALHDMPQSEVMLELEVLEVTRTDLTALGIQWPSDISLTPLSTSSSSSSTVTLADLWNLHKSNVEATVASAAINANTTDTDVQLLANPRVRVRSHETAKIMIGNKLPNVTTTTTSTGVVSENVQYMDVGLKLDVQPTVAPDNEVSMKLNLEVSSVSSTTTTSAGSTVYNIGTRTASTVLRLRDGENQILAGLINNEERKSGNRIPGLGKIPILGRLFGTESNDSEKTEIVLSVTPHIVRNVPREALAESHFNSGTELNFRNVVPEEPAPQIEKTKSNAIASTATPKNAATPVASASSPESDEAATDTTSTIPLPVSKDGKTVLAWQGPKEANVGQKVTLNLVVAPAEGISGIPYSISYDPQIFSIVSVQKGAFLSSDGVASSFSSRIDRQKGTISIAEARADQSSMQTAGELFRITLKALQPATETDIKVTNFRPSGSKGPLTEVVTLPVQSIKVSAK